MNAAIVSDIHEIRLALESLEKKDFHCLTSFYQSSGFPDGCCGDAANLVGLYLLQYHNVDSDYVCGCGLAGDPDQTHAWLHCDGYIIDITADQFNNDMYTLPSTIISKDSAFHKNFDECNSYPFSVDSLNKKGIPEVLSKVMDVIQCKIVHCV